MSRALFISYDGLTDPLGQSQVLPYLEGLAAAGNEMHVLSFEKSDRYAARHNLIAERCAGAGITWHPRRYHKRPPVLATLLDVGTMAWTARWLHRRHRFAIVHCRSYLAALVGARLQRRGVAFVFDMRGFWADERVDAGLWSADSRVYGPILRFFKRAEHRWFADADAVISLTENARDVVSSWHAPGAHAPITVIPCVADLEHFTIPAPEQRTRVRAALGVPDDAVVLVYAGSLGSWYMLSEMLQAFAALQRHAAGRAHFLILTPDSAEQVLVEARSLDLDPASITVRAAERAEMPSLLGAADAGISLIRASFSKRASSPTKVGEYLACGLPIMANTGIGDMDTLVGAEGAGVLIESYESDAMDAAAQQLLELLGDPDRYRALAEKHFSLTDGCMSYRAVYETLTRSTQ
ncbi:MAG: glycosyltransferase family 4 protein [Acidimicrobiia bacterium]